MSINYFFDNDTFMKHYKKIHPLYFVNLKSSFGEDNKIFKQELNKALSDLIRTKNSLHQNDETFKEELNDAINEINIIKRSLNQVHCNFDQKLDEDKGKNVKGKEYKSKRSNINEDLVGTRKTVSITGVTHTEEPKYTNSDLRGNYNKSLNFSYIEKDDHSLAKKIAKRLSLDNLCNERLDENIKKNNHTKDDDINDISTITETNSTQSLLSHEEYFNESCDIIGLELVKRSHAKSTMDENFDDTLDKPNLDAEEKSSILDFPTPPNFESNSSHTYTQGSLDIDRGNYELCSILEEECFEIELRIIQILNRLSFAIATNVEITKEHKDQNETKQEYSLIHFSTVTELDSIPSVVSMNSSFDSSFDSSFSEDDTLDEKNKEEEDYTDVKEDYPVQQIFTATEIHAIDTKRVRTGNKNNTCSILIQIIFIVVFGFAKLHFIQQDRLTSPEKNFFSEKLLSNYDISLLRLLEKNDLYSSTRDLDKEDDLSLSIMKDTTTDLDDSLSSFNEIFLLV